MKTSELQTVTKEGNSTVPKTRVGQGVLASFWKGTATAKETERVAELLNEIHGKSWWLACDCRQTLFKDAPQLAPAKIVETIYLRRLMKRAPHAKGCIYEFEQRQITLDGQGDNEPAPEFGEAPDFTVKHITDATTTKRTRPQIEPNPTDSKKRPLETRLAKQLYWLAQASGWQSAPKVENHLTAFREVAKRQMMATGLSLNDMLYLNAGVWTLGYAEEAFAKCDKAGIAPACWWLQIAQNIDREKKVLTYHQGGKIVVLQVYKDLTVFGGDASAARHPLLVLARIQRLRDGQTVLHSAYAHPIADCDRLMLVDSNLERQTLDDLLALCTWLRDKKGVFLEIDKPLHAWNGTNERPDFVLRKTNRDGQVEHHVIETMGFADTEYEARKAELAGNVICPVYFDRREAPGRNREMMRLLSAWALLNR